MSKYITPEDLTTINKQDKETLATWANLINCWGWPAELKDAPNDANLKPRKFKYPNRRSEMRELLEKKAGHRLVSWLWNKERMTEEEFNDFYAGAYEGDKEAKARSIQRLYRVK